MAQSLTLIFLVGFRTQQWRKRCWFYHAEAILSETQLNITEIPSIQRLQGILFLTPKLTREHVIACNLCCCSMLFFLFKFSDHFHRASDCNVHSLVSFVLKLSSFLFETKHLFRCISQKFEAGSFVKIFHSMINFLKRICSNSQHYD